MRANCWMGKKHVSIEDVPDPQIVNARDAIVKVTATTICGSDLHLYNGFVPAMQKGDILGHEFMGEVALLGKGVKNLKVGDRVVVPIAVREAILNCRGGGIVSILGVFAGFDDKFPLGALMNRGITLKTAQCPVQRYMKPLLGRIERGEIDPSFVVSHHLNLDQTPEGYDLFMHRQDDVMKIFLRP